MIFRQLFEPVSCTYTYLLGCEDSGQALLIDPVAETAERDLQVIRRLGLTLAFTLETHVHADHVTGALRLKHLAGSKIAAPRLDSLACADIAVQEGMPIRLGSITLHPLHTPGHTATHHAYFIEADGTPAVFAGDALLIDGCGRTDFQGGDSRALFRSVRDKLYALPETSYVYPAHDYKGRTFSTIGEEKRANARLALGLSEEAFVRIMADLNLPYPRKMDFAVPANGLCGACPPQVPAEFAGACEPHDQG